MNFTTVCLDTHPLGLVSQKPGKSQEGEACRAWLRRLLDRGVRVVIPAIADYEVRRELVRLKNTGSVARLTALRGELAFLPLTQEALEHAAELWAMARNQGLATADPHALDGDVIVAAQMLLEAERGGLLDSEYVVATSNVGHLARYVPYAAEWQDITP